MAAADEMNIGELPQFATLPPHQQHAVVLRAGGKSAKEIVNTINAEFEMALKQRTIEEWFFAAGKLMPAYLEYNEKMADIAIESAKAKIKKASEGAADTLVELMSNSHEGSVRVRAALGVLAKYVPDRQVILDGGKTNELPPEIAAAIDAKVDSEKKDEDAAIDAAAGDSESPQPTEGPAPE